MKYITTILLLLGIQSYGQVSSLEATYQVIENVDITINGKVEKTLTLESTGFLYKKQNRYIYFQKPNYLAQYPNGTITTLVKDKYVHNHLLCTDTLQSINYTAMDSLILRFRPNMGGAGQVDFNYVQKFELNVFNWVYLPEIKEIQGLRCQKATLAINGYPQWIAWFCPDIPMQAGVDNILDLPGLVVEAECIPIKSKYYLQQYSTTTPIDDSIFWPNEFKQRFEVLADRKRKTTVAPKNKTQKQVELLSNQ
ncbi:MAG: GLPGLI family protein [Chitinophagaceae bacterium]